MDERVIAALLAKREDLSKKIPYFKGLVYGESGFGKTVAAMQIAQAITPDDKTIEFIDFLEGWVSLLNHPGLTKRASRQTYEGLSQLEALAGAISEGVPPFNSIGTVIIDEISSISKADLDTVLKSNASKDKEKDANVPTWPDYYANTERMRRAVTLLLKSNINVIFVAHMREDKLSNGVVVTRPSFTPAFSEIFRQMLHLVAHMTAKEDMTEDGSPNYKRLIQVHPTRTISAKTRIGGLPISLSTPALVQAIVEWMDGKRGSEEVDNKGENLVVVDDIVPSDDPESDAIEIN